jgi:hypothetical protein
MKGLKSWGRSPVDRANRALRPERLLRSACSGAPRRIYPTALQSPAWREELARMEQARARLGPPGLDGAALPFQLRDLELVRRV